jgi:hypothetical protein
MILIKAELRDSLFKTIDEDGINFQYFRNKVSDTRIKGGILADP